MSSKQFHMTAEELLFRPTALIGSSPGFPYLLQYSDTMQPAKEPSPLGRNYFQLHDHQQDCMGWCACNSSSAVMLKACCRNYLSFTSIAERLFHPIKSKGEMSPSSKQDWLVFRKHRSWILLPPLHVCSQLATVVSVYAHCCGSLGSNSKTIWPLEFKGDFTVLCAVS